jgi:hypothetical protein
MSNQKRLATGILGVVGIALAVAACASKETSPAPPTTGDGGAPPAATSTGEGGTPAKQLPDPPSGW